MRAEAEVHDAPPPPGGVELLALRRITPATRFGSSRPDYLLRVGMYFPVAGPPRRRAAARSYDSRLPPER